MEARDNSSMGFGDVLQEKGLDDYENVDGDRTLSVWWKGFTKFTLSKENFQRDVRGPRRH